MLPNYSGVMDYGEEQMLPNFSGDEKHGKPA